MRRTDLIQGKIFDQQGLRSITKVWRLKPDTLVLVRGTFDKLEMEEIRRLEEAAQKADRLIVAVYSDEFLSKERNRRAMFDQNTRAYRLASLMSVDAVVVISTEKPGEIVREITPEVVVEEEVKS